MENSLTTSLSQAMLRHVTQGLAIYPALQLSLGKLHFAEMLGNV